MKIMKWEKIKKSDIILTAVLCVISFSAILIFNLIPISNPTLTVYLSDGVEQSYKLSDIDGHKDITVSEDVIIRLENGRACFLSSDCNDRTCVNYGWLEDVGDYTACLPKGVAICITDGKEGEVDVIV